MKNSISNERGQALVIVALALIGLIGITGLAIDGSMVLADRRRAQNAADNAAMAAALAYIRECDTSGCDTADEITNAKAALEVDALDRALSNGYVGDLLHSEVEVYTCDDVDASCAAPYAGDSDYVQVIIKSHLDTTFAQIIGIPKMHNTVQAIALADDDDTGPLFDGRAIIALNPDCPSDGSMVLGGNALVSIKGGGVWANANKTCSFACTSSSVEIDITDGGLSSPAMYFDKFSTHCQKSFEDVAITYNDKQIPYPPETPDLPVPDECDASFESPTSYSIEIEDPEDGDTVDASVISPGYYGNFPPDKDLVTDKKLEKNIVMLPGIYCVQEVKQTGDILLGDDVTIYVRPENGISFEGGITQLKATQTGPFAGYLVVVGTNYTGKPAACKVNGNSYNIFQGSIFAPHCDIVINGDSKTPDAGIDAQIIGYNVTINGGAGLTINYDSEENPVIIDPPKIGVVK